MTCTLSNCGGSNPRFFLVAWFCTALWWNGLQEVLILYGTDAVQKPLQSYTFFLISRQCSRTIWSFDFERHWFHRMSVPLEGKPYTKPSSQLDIVRQNLPSKKKYMSSSVLFKVVDESSSIRLFHLNFNIGKITIDICKVGSQVQLTHRIRLWLINFYRH